MKIAFIIAAILANTLPRWWPGITGDAFCAWQAFSFVLVGFAGRYGTKSPWWDYLIMLALNNWIDEARHHAETTDPIEIGFAIMATLWLIYKLCKK